MLRAVCVATTFVFGLLSPYAQLAQADEADKPTNPRAADAPSPVQAGPEEIVVGRLAQRADEGRNSGEYTLTTEDAGEAHLIPAPGVSLHRYRGRMIGVTARELAIQRHGKPLLLVQAVTLLEGQDSAKPSSKVVQAAAQEDAVPEILPAPGRLSDEPPAVEILPPPGESWELDSYGEPWDCVDGECYGGGGWGLFDQFWIRGEYLLWWTSGMQIPPLVTTSPDGTPLEDAGVLGLPTTTILYGDQEILDGTRNGLRLRFGGWLNCCRQIGWYGEYAGLEDESAFYQATSDATGSPILMRPFVNINPRLPPPSTEFDPPARNDAQIVDFPDILWGSIAVASSTSFDSAALGARFNLCGGCCGCSPCDLGDACGECCPRPGRVDFLIGYRYFRLADRLQVTEDLRTFTTPTVEFDIFDRFETRNEFHGAEVGVLWERCMGRWSVELLGKVALGNVSQRVNIDGATTTTEGGVADTDPGGLLALSSNIGTYRRDEFTMIPELGATFAYHINPCWRATVGYTLVYWGNVVRAGEQIDLDVNPDLIPEPLPTTGLLRPAFAFVETDFWAQGLSIGLEYQR